MTIPEVVAELTAIRVAVDSAIQSAISRTAACRRELESHNNPDLAGVIETLAEMERKYKVMVM